jgi:hypothetical protein
LRTFLNLCPRRGAYQQEQKRTHFVILTRNFGVSTRFLFPSAAKRNQTKEFSLSFCFA